jgi:hypothetical protein
MRDLAGVLDVRVDLLFEESSNPEHEVAWNEPLLFDAGFHLVCSPPQFRYGPGNTRSLVTITLNW